MEIIKNTNLPGVHVLQYPTFEDERGLFKKIFSGYGKQELELFYSISKKNVLRGMHYQKDEFAQTKIVHVIEGEILDVVININKDSNFYGMFYDTVLSDRENNSLIISKNYAHGFLTLSEKATVLYYVDKKYSGEHDTGILWNSFGFNWGIENPIISERDKQFKGFDEL